MSNKATIASLALLKAVWDISHRDYLENFLPLIATLIAGQEAEFAKGVTESDFIEKLGKTYGLHIPYHPMHAILNRAIKRGLLRLNAKKYYPNPKKIQEFDVSVLSLKLAQEEAKVIAEFQTFCKYKYSTSLDETQARNSLIAYLKDHDVDVVIGSTKQSVLPEVPQAHREAYLFASFVKVIYASDPTLYLFLADIAVGHLFATVLLNDHLESFQGRFRDKYIYLDTGLVLKSLGLEGPENVAAYRDFLEMLKDQGAKLRIFEHNLDEMILVLEGCRPWVDKLSFDPSKASAVCIYLHDSGHTESDIDQLVATLPRKFALLAIEVVPEPDPNLQHEYQIDARALQSQITEEYKKSPYFDEFQKSVTIERDVRSISSIYKLRKGSRPRYLSDAKHTFVTTNATLAHVVFTFDRQEHGIAFSIPTCLTDVFVGTIAWLHTPTIAEKLNRKKLVADCYAALQPSHTLLTRFAAAVDRLRTENEISEDDYVVIRGDRIGREILMDRTYGDHTLLDVPLAKSIVQEARDRITEKDRSLLEEQRRLTQQTMERLSDLEIEHRGALRRGGKLIWRASEVISWLIFIIFFLALIWIAIQEVRYSTRFTKTFFVILAVVTFTYGIDLLKVRHKVKNLVSGKLARVFKLKKEVMEATE